MGYTLRLIFGICLVVSICQLLQCTDIKQHIEQSTDSIKDNFLVNNETNNNQTINDEFIPKTEQIILSTNNNNNNNNNNNGSIINSIKTFETENNKNDKNNKNNTERLNVSKVFDIKKYVSREFHDRNNVYTLPFTTDTEKFLNYNHDYETTTTTTTIYKLHDYSKDFDFDTQLTTPMSKIFDKNYKETVDSVDQTLEHIDNYNIKENDHINNNDNNNNNNTNNTNMDYKSFRNIIMKNTTINNKNNKSIHGDLMIEEGKKLNYISNYNETRILDEQQPKNGSENIKINKNQYETTTATTRKNLILTKPPSSIRNNSHISILSNRIETETLKAIDPIPTITTTTETLKINEQSVQENQIIPIQIKAPTTTTTTTTTTTESTTENIEITTQSPTTTELLTTTEIPEILTETTTEIITTIDPITTTTDEITTTTTINSDSTETTIISTEDTTIPTSETSWRSSKEMTNYDDKTTTEIIKDSTTIETTTENLDKPTTETSTTTTVNSDTTIINQITKLTEIENGIDETTTETPTITTTEISTESIITELPTTLLKTETQSSTETLAITTELPEITEINRISKQDDTFRNINRLTTEMIEDEFTTMITTSDSSEIIADHSDSSSDGDNGKIIAIIISSVGAICLIILAGLLFIMRKRQKRFNYGQRCRPVSLDDYSMDNISVYNNSVRRKGIDRNSKRSYGNPAFEDPASISHPLNFPALGKFATNFDDLIAEFEEIPQITAKTNELPDGCDTKNRYANVIPLPETRVFLNLRENCPNSDYINANYVTGPKNIKGYYIACQAPMQNTVDDFWRMIWEQQCKVILMLTHLYENGVEKCFDYLPPSEVLDCHRLFGDYQVTLKKREVKDKYIISILQLKNMVSNSWREITHFWYLGWPDKGVPSEANSLIAFLIEARSYMKTSSIDRKEISNGRGLNSNGNKTMNEMNPVVVHCSPGTGRTGVVIACDIAIREFEQNRLVDIPRIVYRIRRDRASAVQTKEQYMFIYKVISLYATKLTGGALDSL